MTSSAASKLREGTEELLGFCLNQANNIQQSPYSIKLRWTLKGWSSNMPRLMDDLLANAKRYQQNFQPEKTLQELSPMNKPVCVLCCMDHRVIPEKILGLDIGDAEVIRNGGGRVTPELERDYKTWSGLFLKTRFYVNTGLHCSFALNVLPNYFVHMPHIVGKFQTASSIAKKRLKLNAKINLKPLLEYHCWS